MTESETLSPPSIPGLVYKRWLASGGFSEVFLYERQMPLMLVAVKVLNRVVESEELRKRFVSEVNAMARLDHPYIVQVFAADIAPDGRPYMTLKYFSKPNLAESARTRGLSVPEVLRLGVQLAGAVETAHRAGILHRDIKPQNILMSHFDTPGLTDFGIAATTAVARASEPVGVSYPWSPPEAIFPSGNVDRRSDVYSLAATLWHLLAGRSPFALPGGPNDDLSLIHRIDSGAPTPIGRSDVPVSLERVLRQAMSHDPNARPESALAFGRSLQSIEQQQRLTMTQLIIPTDEATPHAELAAIDDDDEDATRRGRPAVIDPQPTFDLPVVRDRGDQRPTHSRVGDQDATIGPPAMPTPVEPARQEQEAARMPSVAGARALAAVGAALALTAAGVIFVVLHGRGSSNDGPTMPDPGPTQTAVVPPGMPQVTVKQLTPSSVQFSWTYSDPQPDDTFRWQVDSGTPMTSSKPLTDPPIQATAGHPACLRVIVIRKSGLVSPESTPTCSGG